MISKLRPWLLLGVMGCSPAPAVLEGGDELGESSVDASGSDASGSDASDADPSGADPSGADTSGDGESTGAPSVCSTCDIDEMCVGEALYDICIDGGNYEVYCVPASDSCRFNSCGTACLFEVCGEGYECRSECSGDPVDVWCGSIEFSLDECNLAAQNCPDGEKCVPSEVFGNTTASCVPIQGDAQPGEACTTMDDWHDDCVAGSYCAAGTCQRLCDGQGGCPLGESCRTGWIPACLPVCDGQGNCPDGRGCVVGDTTLVCGPTVPTSEQGSTCELASGCSSGFTCVVPFFLPGCAGEGCCTAYCDTTDLNACDGLEGLSCLPMFNRPLPGFETLGRCIAP